MLIVVDDRWKYMKKSGWLDVSLQRRRGLTRTEVCALIVGAERTLGPSRLGVAWNLGAVYRALLGAVPVAGGGHTLTLRVSVCR